MLRHEHIGPGREWTAEEVDFVTALAAIVGFEVESSGAEIVCTVRDQGIGIPEADREWLFSPFHRCRNAHDRPGIGLGLVIVKRCVDLHGGIIQVQSKCGEGTVVTVKLPNEVDRRSDRGR
jgi:signal transduction histidine kinase